MYYVLDNGGNIIRITDQPVLTDAEIEAGYRLHPPPKEEDILYEDKGLKLYEVIPKNQEDKKLKTEDINAYTFRNTFWGMNKEKVKASEDAELIADDEEKLVYITNIGGNEYYCIYSFWNNILCSAGYYLNEKHTNRNEYIRDYEYLKEILLKKYSKPEIDRISWDNDLYKNDKSQWDFAVSLGHLSFWAHWKTPSTIVRLSLNGDNYVINCGVIYASIELLEKESKYREEKVSENF